MPQHSYLMPAEAHAALGYYFDNQAEIDGEIEAELRELQASKASEVESPFLLRMRGKGLL